MKEIEKTEKIKLENLRKMRAYAIIAKGDMPKVVNDGVWVVPSQSNPERTYTIHRQNGSYVCDCPDHMETGLRCKHIQSVQMWVKFRKSVNNDILELKAEIGHPQCGKCGSLNVVKNAKRKTKQGLRQTYKCKECGYRFTPDPIKSRKGTTKLVALCMDLFFKGLSLRKIADTIEQFYHLKLHHDTIRVWITTFMNKINKYVAKYNPDLGEVWNIDEQQVKSEGDWIYSWNVLDEKTRFLIANTITKERSLIETEKVFHKAISNVENKPRMIVTDKMNAYPYAIKENYPETIHIKAGIRDAINNNKLERFHGTWRERDKVMRGLKTDATTEEMLENYRTYYNFIRPHMGLNGKTPAEVAKIDLELEKNRWIGLIEQSL